MMCSLSTFFTACSLEQQIMGLIVIAFLVSVMILLKLAYS